ncbi:MAG: signal peptidase I [Oscillatoriales cyanobacterium SM2_1_8]|nr:signal peptidase I [Oscillatoriales cyanobacterium SM2_1_8]
MTLPRSSTENAPPEAASAMPWWQKGWADNLKVLAIALVVALTLRFWVVEPRYIPSGSMEPTLQVGDRIAVEKVSYRFWQPQRGDIVVFYPPGETDRQRAYIKRIVGLPGDRLQIQNGRVYANGEPLPEPYLAEPIQYTLVVPDGEGAATLTVPANAYWVMGDNRNNSNDSHVWGYLPRRNLIGRAVFRFYPPERFGPLPRPAYP